MPLRDDLGAGTVLLRPDGVVAWSAGAGPIPRRSGGRPAAGSEPAA
ncbi:hypothetical protein WHI96_19875 [Pseudonocardia tropica]|uniref:Uncharacterized protein n=1 Tax=Pseudonocardia tropica TaxID=681289 RepID=A0ABV1JYN2_9PSEU